MNGLVEPHLQMHVEDDFVDCTFFFSLHGLECIFVVLCWYILQNEFYIDSEVADIAALIIFVLRTIRLTKN